MKRGKTQFAHIFLGMLSIVAFASACSADPETIIQTVVVTNEVEKQVDVIQTVIVTNEVEKQVDVIQTVIVTNEVEKLVTPTPAPASPKGPVTWTIGFPEDVTTYNIWDIIGPASTAYNFYAFANQYPTLMGLSDKRFDYVPVLAAEFPTDPAQEGDFWVTTVGLKKAKWSDGSPITADDFVFTVDTALTMEIPGNWSSNIDKDVVDHAEAVDGSTLKIYFKSAPGLSRWQFGLAQQAIVSKKFWEPLVNEIKAAGGSLEDQRSALFAIQPENEPIAGEMDFIKWEEGAFVSMDRNDDYFWQDSVVKQYANGAYEATDKSGTFVAYGSAGGDVDLQVTRGVQSDTVNFSVFASQDAAVLALRGGEIDYFLSPLGLSSGLKSQVQGQPGIATIQNPANGFRYLGFNLRRAPMDSTEFRQAVATLIDKEFLAERILQNAAVPIYTVVPEGNGFWWNPEVPQFGKGMTREDRINDVVVKLKGAGFTWTKEPAWNADGRKVDAGEGLKDPNGVVVPELEILTPSAGYDPLRATAGIWIEQWLKEAGIPVKANLTGFNVIVPRVYDEQDFDMWILGWGLTVYPDYLADFFTSDHAGLGDLNAGGYSNPEFDALAKDFIGETNLDAARTKAFTLQAFLAEDLPYVTLFTTPIIEAYRTDSFDFAYTEVIDGLQNYFQWMNGPLSNTVFE